MSDSSALAASQKSNSKISGGESNSAFADAVQRARQIAAKIHHPGSDNITGLKRPLEDMNGLTEGTPEIKKLASSDPYGSQMPVPRNCPDFVIEEYHVPDKMVGLIIGRGGEQIIRLQAETGCKIQLASDSGGLPDRPCTLTGNRDAVQKVKMMINQIINKANSPYPPDMSHLSDGQYTAEMMIPGPKVGLLIGKGGENIKNLQEKGGVKMVLIQEGPEQTLHEKPLRISGDPQKVELLLWKEQPLDFTGYPPKYLNYSLSQLKDEVSAKFTRQMVLDLLAQKDMERFSNGGGGGGGGGGGAQEEIMVPKQAVGVVIGKSGDMIKRIQNDSGARVQFVQGKEDTPGDKLCHITGNPDQVQKAVGMIQELIQSVMVGDQQMGTGDGAGRGRGRGRGRGGGMGMRPDFGPGGPRMRGPDGGPSGELQFTVPANKCGLVIGKGGETIRSINQQSGAHVEIARNGPMNPNEKLFLIRGNPQQIEHAKQLICERIGMPPGPAGPQGGPAPQGPPGQYPPQYPQQFQQPGPGQPYGAPGWGNPYQQWQGQPGGVVNPNDATKAAADANAAAWAAYYAQFYGQPGQPQPSQMQPQPQPQAQTAPGAQPDYSAAWAEYYRSLGMFREAEMIEQQARNNQTQGSQQPPGGTPGAPAMGPPAGAGAVSVPPGQGQQVQQQPAPSVTPAAAPAPSAGVPAAYPAVYPQPGQQPAPGPVPYAQGPYPGYSYAYGGQQPFVAPAQQ